jgi:DNA recombination protein RmuC
LGLVRAEFLKFGDILEKVHKQIQTADKTLEDIVGKRTRAINRTLRAFEKSERSDIEIEIEESTETDEQ